MTEYEIYSYEAFRKKYHDEAEAVPRATKEALDPSKVAGYLLRLRASKEKLAPLDDETLLELMSITKDGAPTVRRVLAEACMSEPLFENRRGEFKVTLRDAAGGVSAGDASRKTAFQVPALRRSARRSRLTFDKRRTPM